MWHFFLKKKLDRKEIDYVELEIDEDDDEVRASNTRKPLVYN